MNTLSVRIALLIGLLTMSVNALPQCEIKNRVSPDGSMLYYMEPVSFYWTSATSLKGCIVTDKESYFLELRPLPFPEKPAGNKLKSEVELVLSDGKSYMLRHFDTRYVEDDTVMELIYLISKDDLNRFDSLEVNEARIDMKGDEGIRSYVFKLHKTALKEQLACFLNEEKERKKK